MFNPEIIVGLWFVPVVLFIIIPLSMLCVWTVYQLMMKLFGKIGLIHKSLDEAGNDPNILGLHSESAV